MFKTHGLSLAIIFAAVFVFSFTSLAKERQFKSLDGLSGDSKERFDKDSHAPFQTNEVPWDFASEAEPFIEIYNEKLEMKKNGPPEKGRVDIYYQDTHLQADRVQVNSKSGNGMAVGHVVIKDGANEMTADKIFFNFNSQKGVIYNAKGHLESEYFITGEKIKKIGKDKYKIYNGTLTTCLGDNPFWIFKCDYANLTVENYAFLKNASFRVNDIPFLYFPYGYIPIKTKRATGFLFPFVGFSSKDGFFINNRFFWAINDQMDATLSVDYLEKKGARPGLEFRYMPTRKIAGQFNGSYIKEKDTGDTFWKINFDHNQELSYGIKALAKVDLLSGNNYDREFVDSTLLRTRRISDSHISLLKNWDNRSLEILARYRKSIEFNREEKFNLLPQITFRNQREKILDFPLYFNMESSYTGFDRQTATMDTYAQRFDFHPQLSLPLTPFPWISLTSTVGLRETYYSRGATGAGNKTGGFSRELYDINTVLEGPKFSKVITSDNSFFSKVKHIVEPRIAHNFVPDIDNADRSKIIVFDHIDSIIPLNNAQYSLTNRFLKKARVKNDAINQTEEFLRFDISQNYDFLKTSGQRPFSDIRWDVDSQLSSSFGLNFDGTYDVYDGLLKTANIELRIIPKSFWSIYFERRFIRNVSTFMLGTLALDFKKGWGAKYSAWYDELNNEFQENNFSLVHSAQCWDISFDYVNRNNFINGQKQRENKFFFLITLKGLGAIGNKQDAQLLHRGL